MTGVACALAVLASCPLPPPPGPGKEVCLPNGETHAVQSFQKTKPKNRMPCRRGTVNTQQRTRAHAPGAARSQLSPHTCAAAAIIQTTLRRHVLAFLDQTPRRAPAIIAPASNALRPPKLARSRDTIITVVANFKRSLRPSVRIGDKNSGAVNVQQTGSAACLVVMSQTSCRLVRAPTNKSIYLPMFS
jgi:hypothetical protein